MFYEFKKYNKETYISLNVFTLNEVKKQYIFLPENKKNKQLIRIYYFQFKNKNYYCKRFLFFT